MTPDIGIVCFHMLPLPILFIEGEGEGEGEGDILSVIRLDFWVVVRGSIKDHTGA